MAKDLNKVLFIGRLGADPEMRFTPQGSAVTTFRAAATRSWKDSQGEQHSDTEWFQFVAWNKLAEIINQYATTGMRIYAEGRLQTRSWEDATTGETKYRTEVIVSDIIFLDGGKNNGERHSAPGGEEDDFDTAPPARPKRPATTAATKKKERYSGPEVEADDLPF